MVDLNSESYRIFLACLENQPDKQQAIGRKPRDWYQSVTGEVNPRLEDKQLCRETLRKFCKNDNNSHAECVASVMSWGGQRVGHGKMLFNRFNEIEPIISDMRMGAISHYEAYERFDSIWKKPQNLGMGAAYFTKLIFFCDPTHNGYIMDQWTSKSVNLLKGEEIVHLTYGYVDKRNTVDNYKNFCEFTDGLAEKLGVSGEDVEIAMFSKGGSKKWSWRQYVVNQDAANQNKE